MSGVITVFVQGLEFYAYHGVPAEERSIGHRYRADISLEVVSDATENDAVEDTVDYADVAKRVESLAKSGSFRTVERVASLIADDILAAFPRVDAVKIRLSKPFPPAPIIADSVGVELSRRRG